jgi:[ribosomal protein S5]-alanine N-acetyltransferase
MGVRLRAPRATDRETFIAAVRRSAELHRPWTTAPDTDEMFDAYLERAAQPSESCRLVVTDAGELVGVYNLSQIARGGFQNAYLGYYAFAPLAGTGLMRAAMPLVFAHAFDELELHRLQANVQPDNARSRKLLETTGWREEGFAPRYLFIDGDWRDHVLYAITVEDRP